MYIRNVLTAFVIEIRIPATFLSIPPLVWRGLKLLNTFWWHLRYFCRFFRPSRIFCTYSKHCDRIRCSGQVEWNSKCFIKLQSKYSMCIPSVIRIFLPQSTRGCANRKSNPEAVRLFAQARGIVTTKSDTSALITIITWHFLNFTAWMLVLST